MENDVKSIESKAIQEKAVRFNWTALGLWLLSLVISLLPFYISLFKYLSINNKIDLAFWNTEFIKSDVLWVFSTILLFALADSFSVKNDHDRTSIKAFRILGFIIFMFSETTWILLSNFDISSNVYWPLILSLIFIVLILVFATPLKISFIKKEG